MSGPTPRRPVLRCARCGSGRIPDVAFIATTLAVVLASTDNAVAPRGRPINVRPGPAPVLP